MSPETFDARDKRIALIGRFADKGTLEMRLTAAGATVSGSVGKRTDVAILGTRPGKKQLAKASELGVPTRTEAQLAEWLAARPRVEVRAVGSGPPPTLEVGRLGDETWLHDDDVAAIVALGAGRIVTLAAGRLTVWRPDGTRAHVHDLGEEARHALFDNVGLWPVHGNDSGRQFVVGPSSTLAPLSAWQRCQLGDGDTLDITGRIETSALLDSGTAYYLDVRAETGRLVVGDGNQAHVLSWDGAVQARVVSPLAHAQENGVAVSADAVAFAHWEHDTVVVIGLDDGAERVRFTAGKVHGGMGVAMQYSPDGAALVTVEHRDHRTHVVARDTRTTTVLADCELRSGDALGIEVSPDSTAAIVRQVGIDVVGVSLGPLQPDHADAARARWRLRDVVARAVAWAPDGRHVYLGIGRRVLVVDAATGKAPERARGLGGAVTSLAVGRDAVVAVAAPDAVVIELDGGQVRGVQPATHVHPVAGSLDEVVLRVRSASQGFETTASLYDLARGHRRKLMRGVFEDLAHAGSTILTVDGYFARPQATRQWTAQGQLVRDLAQGQARVAACSPDGLVMLAAAKRALTLWRARDGQQLWSSPVPHASEIVALAAHGPRRFASADATSLHLWDGERPGPVGELALDQAVVHLAFVDADRLLIVLREGRVGVIEGIDEGEPTIEWRGRFPLEGALETMLETPGPGAVGAAAFRPGDGLLVVGTGGSQLLWTRLDDLATGEVASVAGVDTGGTADVLAAWSPEQADGLDVHALRRVRDALLALEGRQGVGARHGDWTRALREAGRLCLMHVHGLTSAVVAVALSPDGRHLALGSWINGDCGTESGEVVVWDVVASRVVSVIAPLSWGVGWPGYGECLQWSPDGEQLGVAYCTNVVSPFLPFDAVPGPLCEAWVTNGWSRPPAFCWSPDGRRFAVGAWGPSPVPGCVVDLSERTVDEDDARWFGVLPAERVGLELQPQKHMVWRGDRLVGINDHDQLYAVDVEDGSLAWCHEEISRPMAVTSDGARVYACGSGGVVEVDLDDGAVLRVLRGVDDIEALHPSPDGLRLAVVGSHGVAVFELRGDAAPVVVVDGELPGRDWELVDAARWAWLADGRRAVCLAAEGQVQVWRLDDARPVLERTIEVPGGVVGVLAGARDTIIGVGRHVLGFWSADSGAARNVVVGLGLALEERVDDEPEHPLINDEGEDLGEHEVPHPCFAIDERWVVARASGEVVVPDEGVDGLDAHLAWVVERRLAWPWRWGR